jgi:hypothetical protein
MEITSEHISSASGKQLSKLFGAAENTVTGWTLGHSEVSGRVLSRAASVGIPKEVLMKGLDLRRQRAKDLLVKRQELDSYLAGLLPQAA